MNPHLGFGFGHHKCLGATHARTLLKVFIEELCNKIGSIKILGHEDNIESLNGLERKVGFHKLTVKMAPATNS